MSEYPPSGVLFSNKKKTKETSPDYAERSSYDRRKNQNALVCFADISDNSGAMKIT